MNPQDAVVLESVLRKISVKLRELAESADLGARILAGSRTVAERTMLPHAKLANLVDDGQFAVRWNGRQCRLGQSVLFRLFRRLAMSLDDYVSYEALLDEVWGTTNRASSTVRNAARRLRRRLEAAGMEEVARAIDGSNPGHYGLYLDRMAQPAACDRDATRMRP